MSSLSVSSEHIPTSDEVLSEKSRFPNVQIAARSQDRQHTEADIDAQVYDALNRAHAVDADGNFFIQQEEAAASDSSSPALTSLNSALPHHDASTLDFLEKASTTLSRVMQHDSHAIFHYKSLLVRAKRALRSKRYDESATLFKEASKLYFDALQSPYAKIANSKALGQTIEQRIASTLEKERTDTSKSGGGVAATAAQQFREKELANLPNVHSAIIEFQQTLQSQQKNKKNTHADAKRR